MHQLMTKIQSVIWEKEEHVREALGYNGYPNWMLAETMEETKEMTREEEEATTVTNGMKREEKKRLMVIPYIRGFSEELKRNFGGYGISTYFRPTNTPCQLLVHPKDPLAKDKVVDPVYKINCEECEATYVGETEHSLKARFGEHRRPISTTSEVLKHIHTDSPNNTITLENMKILSMEHKWLERRVKEAIYIRALKPSSNRD